MIKPSWTITIILAVAAGLIGSLYTISSPVPSDKYYKMRYKVRQAFGLPKFWAIVPSPDKAIGREEVKCPAAEETIVIVTGGQSNAANNVPVLYEAKSYVVEWFNNRCYKAIDPLLGANGSAGSIWLALGDRLSSDLNSPVMLINGAMGGTQFSDWVDKRSNYYNALINRVKSAISEGYAPKLILWHQGETDAESERNMGLLKNSIETLTSELITDIPTARLYLFLATKCIGKYRANGVENVRSLLVQTATNNPKIITGMNTDKLGNDFRWDTCHFNSLGRKAIVEYVNKDIISIVQ